MTYAAYIQCMLPVTVVANGPGIGAYRLLSENELRHTCNNDVVQPLQVFHAHVKINVNAKQTLPET